MALRRWAVGVIVSGADPIGGIRKVRELGLDNCQMTVPPEDWRHGEKLDRIKRALTENGVTVTCVFSGFPGESYADIPTIHDTVGIVPPGTRVERIDMTKAHSDFAKSLGVHVLAAHIGFVPEDPSEPDYHATVAAVQGICDHCEENRQMFALETGQETAETLLRFIKDVDRKNLGVNFDPANMMMYGSGDPIEALEQVGNYVIGAHAKDGGYPANKGELGEERPLGQGSVGIRRFLGKLKEIGYEGPITIEREITGEQQTRDILAAVKLLEELRTELWPTSS